MRLAVTAGGISVNQLAALRAEHGSDEAIVAAHPELADTIRALQQAGEQVAAYARAIANIRPPVLHAVEPSAIDPDEWIEFGTREVRIQREIADELAALRRELRAAESAGVSQDEVDVHPRSKPEPYQAAVFWKAIAMLVEGASLSEIERATKLSPGRVRKIRDWRAHPGQLGPGGSPGYRLYPGETSATLVLKKLRKPR